MIQLSREFLAMTKLQDERPELIGDAVARREVVARVANLRMRLEADLQKMLGTAVWAYDRYCTEAVFCGGIERPRLRDRGRTIQ